jgi:hypothetical protein
MLLELAREEMGLRVIKRPAEINPQSENLPMYPVGTLVELLKFLIELPEDEVVEVKHEALTSSNIATLHQKAKLLNVKFHAVRNGEKRLLWVTK